MIKFQWPLVVRKSHETGTMTSRGEGDLNLRPYQSLAPYVSYSVFQNNANWQNLQGMQSLFNWYCSNPVFYSIVQIKARADSNKTYQVCHRKTNKVEPESTLKEIPRKIYRLLNQPNCMQNRWEFLKQKKIFKEVCGNSMLYANAALGFKPTIPSVNALWNVWPQYMSFRLTGKYFEATQKRDIISKWIFEYGSYKKEFEPEEILHQNSPNTDVKQGLIFGTATAYSLVRPYSNIDMAYESRNVIMKNRGMRLFIASDKGDANGKVPLTSTEKKTYEDEWHKYGLLEGQQQAFFTTMPMRPTPIDQDVMKLGLFEEIATDAMVCCHAHGVPEILLKLYLSGATFENQKESLKRLYQDTIIPESEDDDIGLNNFFGLEETDWYIRSSFDHIEYLQKSKQESATANNTTSQYMERLFLIGGVTLNQWLQSVSLGEVANGNRTIHEMEPEERALILQVLAHVTESKPQDDQQQNQNGQQQGNGNGQTEPPKTVRNGVAQHFM